MYEITYEELLKLIQIALAMKENAIDDDTYIINKEGFDRFCDVCLEILARHNKS